MTDAEVLDLFRHSGALLEGHFRLSSGLHSDRYLQSALVLQHRVGQRAHDRLAEVGRALGVRAIFAERQDGALTLRRGFSLSPSDRVLVVEDVITTGGSTRETIAVAEAYGARVLGAAAIIDRGIDSSRLSLPLQTLARLEVPAYPPEACPSCAKGLAVVKPGSRA